MLKIYSKGCEYVLRALAMIPAKDSKVFFLAEDLCSKAKIPEASTRKAFQKLAGGGLLEAVTGPGGGYRLARNPADISLYSIILCVDGEEIFDQCIMGLPLCDHQKPCPIHYSWMKMKRAIIAELKNKRLKDLMKIAYTK